MSTVLAWSAGLLGAAAVVLLGLIALTPRDHVVDIVAMYPKSSPDSVWRLLTDHAAEPAWLKAFSTVTREADNRGRPVWTHRTPDGRFAFTVLTIHAVPGRYYERILLRENQPRSQPWDGRWVYTLEPAGSGTRVHLIEHGWTGGLKFFLQQRLMASPSDFPRFYLTQIGVALGNPASLDVRRTH
jgi:uncharacterized protein YndB with AHSA1/START domain